MKRTKELYHVEYYKYMMIFIARPVSLTQRTASEGRVGSLVKRESGRVCMISTRRGDKIGWMDGRERCGVR